MQSSNQSTQFDSTAFGKEMQELTVQIRAIAAHCEGNAHQLLALLRLLESLHKDIRETLFQDALPDNRQALYALLRDIELHGGWPYIYRLRLRDLLERLEMVEQMNLLSAVADTSCPINPDTPSDQTEPPT